jgi:hypothetical protein
MAKILGGTKSQSQSQQTSQNLAFQPISDAFNPLLKYASQGANSFARLLGGDSSEFDAYKRTAGYDFMKERGLGGVGAGFAGGRMLGSGAAAKAMQEYGSNFENTFSNNYLDKLLAMANLGSGAAGAITQAGNYSQGTSQSKEYSGGGLLGGLMKIGGAVAMSDRRLKTDIEQVGELSNGLKLYSYKYFDGSGPFVGVMADEVEQIQPEALGPVIAGYKSVDYSQIEGF